MLNDSLFAQNQSLIKVLGHTARMRIEFFQFAN